eukprot:CAMPEP_0172674674 /NCGR_PEP_ID=MMETSP1074-20121228/12859_1 /TAXON_ID=2916 /ORGANISM="Ceratium fusus, Strain PA161109" /LENGTH=89 /DNA_ID=CAMNT_0013492097 /DNA_START=326 /DNA_END=596 /DNA_ORIENTATION=-
MATTTRTHLWHFLPNISLRVKSLGRAVEVHTIKPTADESLPPIAAAADQLRLSRIGGSGSHATSWPGSCTGENLSASKWICPIPSPPHA